MVHSSLGSGSQKIIRFTGSNADEILEFLRQSADASEIVRELICDESIGDEDVSGLRQFMFNYHRFMDLTNLELPHNELTPTSGPALASIMSLQHETLQGLSLAHNPFTSAGLQQILEPMLEPLNSHSPQPTNLLRLDLTETQLGSKGGLVVAQLLRNNSTLQQLNLANNSIGTKGIKAIVSELIRNSSLRHLNLSYNNIKARGATLLAQALENSTSVCNLRSLDLTGNSVGHQGMQTLSKMLTVNRTIRSLYAGINNIGPEGAAHLAFAMKQNYTLKNLHINDNQIGPDAASLLFDQLRDDNRSLETLNLAGNNIGTQGANDLTVVFAQNAVLTDINLSGNNIRCDGTIALMDAMSYNISLVHLNLSNNRIGDLGARAISKVLTYPKCRTLQTISWEENPDISEDVLATLSRIPQINRNREHWLDKFLQNLIRGMIPEAERKQDWTGRNIGNEEVILLNEALNDPVIQAQRWSLKIGGPLLTSHSLVPLFKTCLSPPSYVRRLFIKDCGTISDECTQAIAKSLPHSKSLEILSLMGCGITPEGASKIAKGLRQNETLRHLNLDDNHIGDHGLEELASVLPHQTLTSLSANGNLITDASMGSEGLALVRELHLKQNQITDGGALDFAKNLFLSDGRSRVTWVSLQDNRVTKRGGETIRAFIPEVSRGSADIDFLLSPGGPKIRKKKDNEWIIHFGGMPSINR